MKQKNPTHTACSVLAGGPCGAVGFSKQVGSGVPIASARSQNCDQNPTTTTSTQLHLSLPPSPSAVCISLVSIGPVCVFVHRRGASGRSKRSVISSSPVRLFMPRVLLQGVVKVEERRGLMPSLPPWPPTFLLAWCSPLWMLPGGRLTPLRACTPSLPLMMARPS